MAEQVNVLFGKKRGGIIGTLQLDVTNEENHQFENQVTEFPVENGLNVTDFIRQLPDKLTMSCFVTNTPIDIRQESNAEIITNADGTFEFRDFQRAVVNNRVTDAFEQLLTMSGRKVNGETIDAQIVKVVTGLRVYTNMAIQTITIPRNFSTGQALRFNISFIHIEKVQSETIELPDSFLNVNASSNVNIGKQNKKETTTNQDAKAKRASIAFKLAKRFF